MPRALGVGLVTLAVAALTLSPIAMLIYGSLHSTPPGEPGNFSLQGYRALLSAPTGIAFRNTIVMALLETCLSAVFAVTLAWLIARTDVPGRGALEVLLTLPFFIPPVLTATAWGMLATPRGGLINLAWTALTGSSRPLVNIYSFGGVVWHMMQYTTPFLFLMMVTALRSMDPALEESSRMSGASSWTTFRRITLAVMLPVTTSGLILAFVRGVEAFESPLYFGTPARIEFMSTQIYNRINHSVKPDYQSATALGVCIMVLMFALVAGQWRALRDRSFFTVTGRGYAPKRTRLGRRRWAAFAFCAAIIVVSVVLPIGQLVLSSFVRFFGFYRRDMLTLENYTAVWQNDLFWRALRNTLLLGFAGATLTMLLGAVVAWILLRTRGRMRKPLEIMAWLPWMMPGIVLGVGFLWTYALLPGPIRIYGTPWALLLAYITIGLPLAVRMISGKLAQMSVDLEECSRVHGAGWITTFVRILLPLMWPAFAAGWVFMFFIILRELSASILLYGAGSEVLSVVVMQLWSEGKGEQVSVIALVMLVFVFAFRYLEARIVRRSEQW